MGVSERKAREREQRRELLIDTAERVFFKHGYEVTTMAQIAKEAEFSKRTLYLYFRDKEELVLAVAARGLTILQELLLGVEKGENGWAWMRALLETYFKFAMDYPDYFAATMVFETKDFFYGEAPDHLGTYGRQCWTMDKACSELCHSALIRGLEDQSIASPLTPAQLTLLIWSQITGILHVVQARRHLLEDVYAITGHELFDHFLNQLSLGLCGPKA